MGKFGGQSIEKLKAERDEISKSVFDLQQESKATESRIRELNSMISKFKPKVYIET